MHKLVFINPNHRKFSGKVIDGGFSRNCAWESWLLKEKGNLIDVKLKKGKVIHLFQIFVNLLLRKNDTVFFLYPRVGAPLYQKDGVSKVCTKAFFKGIDLANKKNRVVFDIADLKYEQAIDLELANEDVLPRLHEIEERLFSTKSYFIFASYQMREYVCRKYNVDYAKTDVCINGGHLLKDNLSSMSVNTNIVNYVYAGTLNKGRQIEQLISSFPDDEKIHLYLLGTNGEWINSKSKNITYLGALEEGEAQSFVSKCDVGLIPYDNERLYYNIAYPTKLSFYLTAGIPYLSTPVAEVERENIKIDGGWLHPISEWNKQFLSITKNEIKIKKQNVIQNSRNYLWDSIFEKNQFL